MELFSHLVYYMLLLYLTYSHTPVFLCDLNSMIYWTCSLAHIHSTTEAILLRLILFHLKKFCLITFIVHFTGTLLLLTNFSFLRRIQFTVFLKWDSVKDAVTVSLLFLNKCKPLTTVKQIHSSYYTSLQWWRVSKWCFLWKFVLHILSTFCVVHFTSC